MTATIEQREKALSNFLDNWPISKINSLTLEQYIKIDDKGTLAYWLEFGEGRFLGSIKGGDSSKFGIYERKADPKGNRPFISLDERYSWKTKYGKSAESAFEKIKELILKIINAAQNGDLESIEKLDFESAVKWKLAFLYQNHKQPCILPIYQLKMLKALVNGETDITHSSAYRHLMSCRGQEPTLQYGARLWSSVPEAEDEDESKGIPVGVDGLSSSPARLPLNQILFGPPGTGKTYETIYAALQILDPDAAAAYKQVDDSKDTSTEQRLAARISLKARFDELSVEQRVRFVTFHQSFSYEDFVEGLRAETDDDSSQLSYDVSDGIFKSLCRDAGEEVEASNEFSNAIAIFQEKQDAAGDVLTLKTVRGKLFDVQYDGSNSFRIFPKDSKNEQSNYRAALKDIKRLAAGASRRDIHNASYVEGVLSYLRSDCGLATIPAASASSKNLKPYVLIIDEINRGNISRIFGELITLIEPSKRAGADEALSVTLPYSKERFSVPDNVYLIGTMNTADRSLAGLDLALRRRFTFTEMPPRPELLKGISLKGAEEIDLVEMLTKMNQRITVLLDRDHALGHAYFMPLQKNPTLPRLASIFRQAILPLLQEYFFEDWERIRWVLNDQSKPQDLAFIIKDKSLDLSVLFAGIQDELRQTPHWMLNDKAFKSVEAFLGIATSLDKTTTGQHLHEEAELEA